MPRKFTLGSAERLKSRKTITELFEKGKKISTSSLKLIYLLKSKPLTPALVVGVTVSSKTFSRAVDRNRIKRLIRESYRLQKNSLSENTKKDGVELNLFFIYTEKKLPVYSDIYDEVGKALKKLEKLVGR